MNVRYVLRWYADVVSQLDNDIEDQTTLPDNPNNRQITWVNDGTFLPEWSNPVKHDHPWGILKPKRQYAQDKTGAAAVQ